MQAWLKATLAKLSQKSDVAAAILYALGRWSALVLYSEDGRVEMDNNAAYTASGIGGVMPRSGLCRVGAD
jgi:transposase